MITLGWNWCPIRLINSDFNDKCLRNRCTIASVCYLSLKCARWAIRCDSNITQTQRNEEKHWLQMAPGAHWKCMLRTLMWAECSIIHSTFTGSVLLPSNSPIWRKLRVAHHVVLQNVANIWKKSSEACSEESVKTLQWKAGVKHCWIRMGNTAVCVNKNP